MPTLPSPILIIGDPYVGKNNIIAIKKKFPKLRWVEYSLDTDSLNSIRAESGTYSFDDSEKVLFLNELPDRKQVREFVLDLSSTLHPLAYIIVWDSDHHIKIDPKTKSMSKDWREFLDKFKKIKGSKVLENNEPFTEKDNSSVINFIVELFEKYGKKIDFKEARLLINIVGFDRGMLESDIKKMVLTCPEKLSSQFILDNAFPSSQEAIIYKLGNVMDTGSYENSIDMVERFINYGVNENKIADVIAKKARWQMVVASLWKEGMNWDDLAGKIMEMGKFPSKIWHNNEIDVSNKKRESEIVNTPEGIYQYMSVNMGIPKIYFKPIEDKKGKKKSETIPQYFMASQIVDFVRNMVEINRNIEKSEIKNKLMNRAIKVYQFIQDKLFEIRTGANPIQDLQEMIKVMTNRDLSTF